MRGDEEYIELKILTGVQSVDELKDVVVIVDIHMVKF